MSLQVAREFAGRQGGWETFFATTYTFEIELFDEYLFRRLGDPPLNATVLCDHERLARRLDELGPGDTRLLRRANRDYLLRGVHQGGAFHPKTYFFGGRKRGVLLVGSGNLSLRGIEQGKEIFCRFDSTVEEDLPTIRGWRDWIDDLVARVGSPEVNHRWLDVKSRSLEWLTGPATGSLFVSNLTTPLIDQLVSRIPAPVAELHITAPFYDPRARAVSGLVERLKPSAITVYLGAGTSVDGSALESVLRASDAKVEVQVYEPAEFVHAKLVGVLVGDQGWLLSGSANLSQAALSFAGGSHQNANVEAGILVEAPSEVVRAAFRHPNLAVRVADFDAIQELAANVDDEEGTGPALPLRLESAQIDSVGIVTVAYAGTLDGPVDLVVGEISHTLVGLSTAAPIDRLDGGALAWISNEQGAAVSNKVVLDDPAQLRHWLEERQQRSDILSGFDPADAGSAIGEFLLWLNQECIFDIDDTRAAARARVLVSDEEGDGDAGDWSFLDDLAREELRLDPRVDRYRHAGSGLPQDDEILVLLQVMLDKTPAERGLYLVGSAQQQEEAREPGTGALWSADKRLELRVFNILSRWCAALSDPRFVWIGRSAPVRNYTALLTALARCWEEEFLPVERVLLLLETLLNSFIRSETAPGFLLSGDDEDQTDALSRLPDEARSLAAGLLYCSLREHSHWRDWVFRFQSALTAGVELGVVAPDEQTAALVRRLVGEECTVREIDQRLLDMSTYLDNSHWCIKQQRDLGIERVTLTQQNFNPKFGITLEVEGVGIADVRLVSLVRQALAYRNAQGAIVDVDGDRLAVCLDEPVSAMVKGIDCRGDEKLDRVRLLELERAGAGFDRVLGVREAVG